MISNQRMNEIREMSEDEMSAATMSDILKNDVSSRSSTQEELPEDGSHDAIREVREKSRKENFSVNAWRVALLVTLLGVGVAITLTTFKFLNEDEINAFETAVRAFEQFSRTVSHAAIDQQQNMRDSVRTFVNIVTAHAQNTNTSWPFVSLPFFESHARQFAIQSGIEATSLSYIVTENQKEAWIEFANENHDKITEESHMIRHGNLDRLNPDGYHPFISAPVASGGFGPSEGKELYFPNWHYSPPPFTYGFINFDLYTVSDYGTMIDAIFKLNNETVVSRVRKYVSATIAFTDEEHEALHSKLRDSSTEHPHSTALHPVHQIIDDYNSPIVAIFAGGMAWDFSLLNLLPIGVSGLYVVIKNNCEQEYTYKIDGPEAIFIGDGDLHDPRFDSYEQIANLALHTHPDFASTPGHCQYSMYIYPSKEFENSYRSYIPVVYATVVASTFLLVAIVFFVYNIFVNRRNEKLVHNAARSNAVISALFPKNIRDRMIYEEQSVPPGNKTSHSFKAALSSGDGSKKASPPMNRPPLADYFPETTILFADISGFTAWSSVREPSQVFTLLETLYGAFDKIAKYSRVFKVETVGDCYVAATGVPDFHKEHAVYMVRFARKVLVEMATITKELEISLGPDTGDLSLRIGIHSGAVTAGVLRGERARFQLFGDTMNTASRIENTGEEGRIHLSHETAEFLKTFGKGHWLVRRDEPVKVKGKGDIQTYWIRTILCDPGSGKSNARLSISHKQGGDTSSSSTHSDTSIPLRERLSNADRISNLAAREARLVDWNVQMFIDYLKQIVAHRIAARGLTSNHGGNKNRNGPRSAMDSGSKKGHTIMAPIMGEGFCPLEEVHEIIRLPEFDSKAAKLQKNHQLIDLPIAVMQQLHDYVTCIARLYRNNRFHNFEHASHVTMSVIKLLSRIVVPTDLDENLEETAPNPSLRAQLHDHTYGITSDPLTQFACAFSALIHDVDHSGVPNAQLVAEQADIAVRYKNRSVAEQNSMVLSWNLLMEDRFDDLRNCLCETPQELRRFRHLVINGVMATDLTDKELKNLRNVRWDKAFQEEALTSDNSSTRSGGCEERDLCDGVHRKATIVIEHLIQASDVAHTMQHWHVYRKWNERFFRECYAAYKAGRADKDPSEGWYEGEIGFFDYYIIPLAKKLETCGVFGKSSDEYLNYALQNRDEWKARGKMVVADMAETVRKEYENNGS